MPMQDVFKEYICLKSSVYTVLSFVTSSLKKGNFEKQKYFI